MFHAPIPLSGCFLAPCQVQISPCRAQRTPHQSCAKCNRQAVSYALGVQRRKCSQPRCKASKVMSPQCRAEAEEEQTACRKRTLKARQQSVHPCKHYSPCPQHPLTILQQHCALSPVCSLFSARFLTSHNAIPSYPLDADVSNDVSPLHGGCIT